MWKEWFWITENKGNNSFSYEKRGASPKIFVAPRKEWTMADLKVWNTPVFEEVNENWKIISCKWLVSLLKIKDKNIYIVDNHNLALYAWYQWLFQWIINKGIQLLHIDQHTDMNKNEYTIGEETEEEIYHFTHEKCNVGNFIQPAITSWLLSEVIMINTEQKLATYTIPKTPYILDIDIDFRDPKMWINEEIIFKVKKLIEHASLVSIATSPYFMDQNQAIEIVKKLI